MLAALLLFFLPFYLPPFLLTANPFQDGPTGDLNLSNQSDLPQDFSGEAGNVTLPEMNIAFNETLAPPEGNQTANETLNSTEPFLPTNESPNLTENLPEINLTSNETIPLPEINQSNETLTIQETNETLSLAVNESLNPTANLSLNITTNKTLGYRVLSINNGIVTILTDNGTEMDITEEALALLENNETVRIIAKSSSDIPSPEGVAEIKDLPYSGINVLEVDKADLATLADSGVNTVYVDTQMEASLTDSVPLIGATLAQTELNYSGAGELVCLLDTGVDTSDPALAGKVIAGYNFVDNTTDVSDSGWHGTFMARAINAIAPDASILVVKVLGPTGTGYSSDIMAGIDFCRRNGANIISMSFGGGNYSEYCDSDPVAQEANAAAQMGMLAVASTGNKGASTITSPACGSQVVAVSSTSKNDTVSSFSNMNPLVALLAPGEAITAGTETRSGTSISAAHVSGAAALLLQSNASLSPPETKLRFQETGKTIDYYGTNFSRINIYSAITGNYTGYFFNQTSNTTNETGNYTYGAQADPGTCPAALSSAGTTYTLTSSYSCANGYNMTAANITLDCAGNTITGTNTTGTAGVYTDQYFTTIKNCNIRDFYYGVHLQDGSGTTASNSTVTGNAYGIFLYQASNNKIINSTFTSGIGFGIFFYSGLNHISSNNSIINSTATGGQSGIALNTVRNTTVTGSTMSPIFAGAALNLNDAWGSTIANNTMNGIGLTALSLAGTGWGSYTNLFINNTLISAGGTLLSISAMSGNNT
ncbi:MAG: S8 family serine peptidase, partial [Candidatus Micrarchaeota archaeon]|nr:S8 family serine peptidase [Candidatus Micrarchaeota archaeon]